MIRWVCTLFLRRYNVNSSFSCRNKHRIFQQKVPPVRYARSFYVQVFGTFYKSMQPGLKSCHSFYLKRNKINIIKLRLTMHNSSKLFNVIKAVLGVGRSTKSILLVTTCVHKQINERARAHRCCRRRLCWAPWSSRPPRFKHHPVYRQRQPLTVSVTQRYLQFKTSLSFAVKPVLGSHTREAQKWLLGESGCLEKVAS